MRNHSLTVQCPQCAHSLSHKDTRWVCSQCGMEAFGTKSYVDLLAGKEDATGAHYSLQWGKKLGFLEFLQNKPQAKEVMAASKLGWNKLFGEVINRAKSETLYIYDAACGFGGIANEIIDDTTNRNLVYVGADIHNSLQIIPEKIRAFDRCGFLMRWDIMNQLPVLEKFDYVLCRAALHHTSDPARTFTALCSSLRPGGTIAISVYNRKSICREAADDALRSRIAKMSPEEAFEVSQEFTFLGRALQKIQEEVVIPEDLPLLGIKKGNLKVQTLIYDHFIKCFYNPEFGERHSTLVNFDWYHPPFAYRFTMEEVKAWFADNKINIGETFSTHFQHYITGEKLGV
jgi:SAM-dependent methyltransferase